MDFAKLIKTKVDEILEKDKDYQDYQKDKTYVMDIVDQYNKEFKEGYHGNDTLREQFGFMHYADILTFKITKYPAEKEWLEKQMAKAIFGKKKLAAELAALKDKKQYADKIINLKEEADRVRKNYEIKGIDKKIKDAESSAVRQVLIENRNEECVEDAFMNSIRKDGCTNMGRYYNGLVSMAYDMIDEEVQKMLKKTKYKEKLDDLKNQLSGTNKEDDSERE